MFAFIREPEDTIDDVVGYLEGTCQSIDTADFTEEELQYLDECIAECCVCGWWYSQGDTEHSDEAGGETCYQCLEDIEEE